MTAYALPRFHFESKPTFCIIAPTPYLDYVHNYSGQSNTHLVLAHIVDNNPVYANFYKAISKTPNCRIIMDNGAFELGESYAPEKLIELGHLCGADAIVLPDYPFEFSHVTIDAAKKWMPIIRDAEFDIMFVPQSKRGNLTDWIMGYEWAADNDVDIIGMSILGIPNALPHIPAAYARVVMTEILKDRGIFAPKYHHYLGLNAGPALEIPALIESKALNSCDSSNPVWMAILGHEYSRNTDSYLAVKKVKKEVDFDFPYTRNDDTHRRIRCNLDLTMALFNV